MLHSMTGFARETAETPFGTMTCEMRAVNHRFLDVQFRLPEELRAKEIDLKNRIGESLKRGKVECTLYLRRGGSASSELSVNQALVEQLAARASEISRLLPESHALDPIDVLRWPGVVTEREIETEPLYAEAVTIVDRALQAMAGMRSSEGERISSMIESRLDDILAIASAVRKRMPEVLDAVRAKQRERIAKLDVEADPARLETELALIAQKLDVDEELDREANTLGSKSADTETTKAAVELKVLIEQMREQVQNVE
jgi:uncharacterized protein (TIGR00255 family)